MAREPLKRKSLGEVPPLRATAKAPRRQPARTVPDVHAPRAHVARAPAGHQVAPRPNPRKPKLVRDVRGGVLRDLFEWFPDLPRPVRPAPRVPLRGRKGRL